MSLRLACLTAWLATFYAAGCILFGQLKLWQLKPDGRLIVVESVKEQEPNPKDRGNKAMEIAKVRKILADCGFDPEAQKIIGSGYGLRYQAG